MFLKIDIPRTGTRSYRETVKASKIYDVIGNDQGEFDQHGTASEAKKQFDLNHWDWRSYYKMTLVRNPWERMASLCMFKKERKPQGNEDQFTHEEMLKLAIQEQPPQDYYFLENGKCLLDRVGRFENYASEFELFKRQIGLFNLKIVHANKSQSYDYRTLFTDELAQEVAEKEKYVIEKFGYQFDDFTVK